MKFTLTIELGNDAMRETSDVADALMRTAERLETASLDGLGPSLNVDDGAPIRDVNGNTVGRWEVVGNDN